MLTHREKIGNLDRRITLKTAIVVRDDYGGESITYGNDFETWAKVEYSSGGTNESYENDKLTAFTRVIFTTRYKSGITKKDVIEYDSNTYEILAVTEISRRRFSRFVCELRE